MSRHFLSVLAIWSLLCGLVAAQIQDTRGLDFYLEFGEDPRLGFLSEGDLGNSIFEALHTQNARALGGYAAILFFAEKRSGLQIRQVSGRALLERATQIASDRRDAETLRLLSQIWQEPCFGPNDSERAAKIIEKIAGKTFTTPKIIVSPDWKVLNTNESAFFDVFFDGGEQVPVEEIGVHSRYGTSGKTSRVWYRAPSFACREILQVEHSPSGHSAIAIVEVRTPEAVPEAATPAQAQPDPSLPPSPWRRASGKKSFEAHRFFGPGDSRILLMKEEEARNQARLNIVNEIQRVLNFWSETRRELRAIRDQMQFARETILAGVVAGEAPYVYPDEPNPKLRVTASISNRALVESLRKTCQRRGVEFPRSMQDQLARIFPDTLEVEGSASIR